MMNCQCRVSEFKKILGNEDNEKEGTNSNDINSNVSLYNERKNNEVIN